MSDHIAASTQSGWVDRPGGRIAYDAVGTGPLVVCVPGMGELRSVYRRTAPALAAAGYRVVTMDLRGHGDSDATFTSYDDVAAGGDVLALIEQLGGPAGVGGNSMGAGAAAGGPPRRPRPLTRPGAVRGVVRQPPGEPPGPPALPPPLAAPR